MIDETKAAQIVETFKGLTVEQRLAALQEAREMFPSFFSGEMTHVEYAKSAMRIEQLYNLIRDELRVEQKRIKADIGAALPSSGKVPKMAKPKAAKVASNTMSMEDMMKAFAAFKKD